MTFVSALAVLVPSYATYLALSRRWGRSEPLNGMLAAAIAPGLGLGFASSIYFLLLLVGEHRWATRLDAIFWLAITAALYATRKQAAQSLPDTPRMSATSAGETLQTVVPAVGFFVLLSLTLLGLWVRWLGGPHGTWDTIAIWTLKARAIARTTPDWGAVVAPAIGWSHPDYPLMLPVTIARLWAYSGYESLSTPMVVAALFLLSTTATLVIAVANSRSWASGFLAGMVLLAATTYVAQSSLRLADMPLGFFVMVAVCFMATARHCPTPEPLLVTAGAGAGLAAWTKNEGMVLVALVWLLAFIAGSRHRGRDLFYLTLGAAAPILTVTLFKIILAPPNDLFAGQHAGAIVVKLLDESRWRFVVDNLSARLFHWGEIPGGALASLGVAVALTAQLDGRAIARALWGLLLVFALLASYAAVYVIYSGDVNWLIATSFDRLVTQLWPAIVWVGFQLTATGAATGRPHVTKTSELPNAT